MTDSPPRWRRGAGMLTAAAVGASLVALPTAAASAAEGPAPAPAQYTVIGEDYVHSDTISTFFDDGQLVLGAKADEPATGTRYDESSTWFFINQNARMQMPDNPAFSFIAPAGTDVWRVSQTGQSELPGVLWAGFSTESVPAGTFDGETTFTLDGVDGPGDVELYLTGTFGGVGERLWSSDEPSSATDSDLKSFSRNSSGVHMHANWFFTAPGQYDLTVTASAQKAGQTLSDTATYTFWVGDLPEDVDTTTTLTATESAIEPGESVTLNATVAPAADGYVEFLDGTTVLGHEPVADGAASFTTTALGLGARSLTARYVPAVENLSNTSTSAAAVVTVAERDQDEVFGVYGELSYATGETIDLRIGGYELKETEQFRWLITTAASEGTSFYVPAAQVAANGHFVRDATAAMDGATLQAVVTGLNGADDAYEEYHESPAVTLDVTGENVGVGEPLRITDLAASYYRGDDVVIGLDGRAPQAGESVRWVTRSVFYETAWTEPPAFEGFTPVDGGLRVPATSLYGDELAAQLVDADGRIVGQSAAVSIGLLDRHVGITGHGAAYRLGDVAALTAEVDPATDDLSYEWFFSNFDEETFEYTSTTLLETASATAEIEITEELGADGLLELRVTKGRTGGVVGGASVPIRITDAQPGEQEVFVEGLAGHYHQGWAIALSAAAFPEASATDTYQWSWQLPHSDGFVDIPDATERSLGLVAEQALDGTLVRVEMFDADGVPLATSEAETIHHDDHGGKPRQVVTVGAPEGHHHSGDEVELTASVEPSSYLTRYAWFVQLPGETASKKIEDADDATLAFEATTAWDGASIYAALVYSDGTASPYPASQPVTIEVEDHGHEEPVTPVLTVSGLKEHYHSGDTMTLTASQEPDSGEDHWHWFLKPAGADEYTVIPGQATSTLTRQVAASDHGASIIARLYDRDHGVIAESAPVVVTVDDHHHEEPLPETGGKPAEAPANRTAADLGSTPAGGISAPDEVRPGQIVTIDLGDEHANEWVAAWMFSTPVLLGGTWVQADAAGVITVQVPADVPAGAHRIAVFAADGSLIGWESVTVTGSAAAVGSVALPGTGGTALGAEWIWAPVLLLAVGAAAVLVTRRRRTVGQ